MYTHFENDSIRAQPVVMNWLRGCLLMAVTVVFGLVSLAGVTLWQIQRVRVLSVQTSSMVPVLQPGDAVVVRPVDTSKLAPGDIVSFYSLTDTTVIVTHRVVATDRDRMVGSITTRGDSNTADDPPLDRSLLIGRVERQMPNAGYVIDFIHSWTGLVVGVYIPAFILCAVELRRLLAFYQPAYRHPSRA